MCPEQRCSLLRTDASSACGICSLDCECIQCRGVSFNLQPPAVLSSSRLGSSLHHVSQGAQFVTDRSCEHCILLSARPLPRSRLYDCPLPPASPVVACSNMRTACYVQVNGHQIERLCFAKLPSACCFLCHRVPHSVLQLLCASCLLCCASAGGGWRSTGLTASGLTASPPCCTNTMASTGASGAF